MICTPGSQCDPTALLVADKIHKGGAEDERVDFVISILQEVTTTPSYLIPDNKSGDNRAMPDLNSLPPSQNPSNRSSPVSQYHPSPSPAPASRSPSNSNPISLSTNSMTTSTGVPTSSPRLPRSPNIERRRSSLLRDFNLNENHGVGGGGNGSSPTSTSQLSQPPFQLHGHHHRTPSLGELHQELENEQEAQVNRLLAMIRQQQAQIQQLRSQSSQQLPAHPQTDPGLSNTPSNTASEASAVISNTAIAPSTPGSSRPSSTVPSRSQSQVQASVNAAHMASNPTTNPQQSQIGHTSTSSSLSRESSYRRPRTGSQSHPSHNSSPSVRAHESTPDWAIGHYGLVGRERERDEVNFYQTETAMVQRENQMLKGRIRELERQIQELGLRTAGDIELAETTVNEE